MQLIDQNPIDLGTQENKIKDKLFCSLVKENAQAVAIVDEELRFVTANAAFCSLLEIPGENYLNCFHISVLPFSKDSNFNSLLEGLVTNKIPRFEIETSFNAYQQNPKFLKLNMVSFNQDNRFNGGVLYLEDITQLKERILYLEKIIQELKQKNANQEKYISTSLQVENFAYLASHDMKEPLRMIGNFSQLFEKRYGHQLDEAGREYLNYIVGGVKNMNQFINDLLSFSKLDNNGHEISQVHPEDVNFMISRSLSSELESKNIQFELEEMPKNIQGCKPKINSLFTHLISNAIKFSKDDGNSFIKIRGSESEDYWKFEIEDNGIGIREEFYDKIFLLFKRLHPRNEYPGSGIGLALCKKIVAQHGGELTVESEFGKGTKFSFTISKINWH